jgi:NitT/TauT family transport system ATP-binding protein
MITLRHLSKSYVTPQGSVAAVSDVDLEFERGTITALFGANGSGKSTLLGMITGLIPPDAGSIQFAQAQPRLGVVFQDFRNSLLPWLTIRNNILRPSVWQKQPFGAAEERLRKLLSVFTLDLPLERHPHQVSGGQAQIACLLRALVIRPQVLVLDEPTSALDFTLQWQTVLQLQRLWTEEEITIVMVSHDPEQALLVADRIIVMGANPGRVVDVIDVPLPRLRTFATTRTPAFLELRDHVLSAFDGSRNQKNHAAAS